MDHILGGAILALIGVAIASTERIKNPLYNSVSGLCILSGIGIIILTIIQS